MMFHTFTRKHRCTYREQDALAWHLAQIRARKIYDRLRPSPRYQQEAIAP